MLRGFLVSTWVPTEERLKFRFKASWNELDIVAFRDEIKRRSLFHMFTIKVNNRKRIYNIIISPFKEVESRLYGIRDEHFFNLKHYCLVIQHIASGGYYRNIYLLPVDNLNKFLEKFDEIKRDIGELNELIKKSVQSERYNEIIRLFKKFNLTEEAERLERMREETLEGSGGWLLPEPQLRLDKLSLRIDDVADMVEDPKTREKVKRILEEQYANQLRLLVEDIKDKVKEAIKKAVKIKSREELNSIRKELRELSRKANSLGLTEVSSAISRVIVELNKAEKISVEEIEEEFDNIADKYRGML